MNTIFLIAFLIWIGIFGLGFTIAKTVFSYFDYCIIFLVVAFYSSDYIAQISYNKSSTFLLSLVVGIIACVIIYFILSLFSQNRFLVYPVVLYNFIISMISSYYFLQFSFYVLNELVKFAEGKNPNYNMLLIFKNSNINIAIHYTIIIAIGFMFFFVKCDSYCIELEKLIQNTFENFSIHLPKNNKKLNSSKEEFEFNIEERKNSKLDYTFDNIENNFKKAEFNKMIDTKTDKFQAKENGGLKYWAEIRNLKDMVKTVDFLIEMNIHSKEDLEEKINEFKGKKTEIFTNYKELKKNFTNEINNLKVLNVYQKYKFIYEESLKEDTSDEFRAEYKSNILEFQKAKEYLTALYGENFPSDEELINKIEEIESEKKSLDDDLDKINQDISNLYVAYSNYDLIRGSSR